MESLEDFLQYAEELKLGKYVFEKVLNNLPKEIIELEDEVFIKALADYNKNYREGLTPLTDKVESFGFQNEKGETYLISRRDNRKRVYPVNVEKELPTYFNDDTRDN